MKKLYTLVMTVCLSGLYSAIAAQDGPNCRNLNAHIHPDGVARITMSELVTNSSVSFPATVTVTNSFGGVVSGPELLAAGSVLDIEACAYRHQALKVTISNDGGTCWSSLTFKQGNLPVLVGRSKTVYCNDPLVSGGHILHTAPVAAIPCGEDLSATFVSDWVELYECGPFGTPANDTAKIIFREYEAFDKEGNRGFTYDTIVVLRLPQIVGGDNAWCRETDTLYCGHGSKVGPYMVVDGPLWGDPSTRQTECNPIFFVETEVDASGDLEFKPAAFDPKCGIVVHVDAWKFGSDGCAKTYKVDVEVKQSCAGAPVTPPICSTTDFLNWAHPAKWSYSRVTTQQGIWFGTVTAPFRTDVWNTTTQQLDYPALKAENAADQLFIGTYNPHQDIAGLTEACITIPQDGTLQFDYNTFLQTGADVVGYSINGWVTSVSGGGSVSLDLRAGDELCLFINRAKGSGVYTIFTNFSFVESVTLPDPLDRVSEGYWRCTFWLVDLDTVPPESVCKYDKVGEQNLLWPLSIDGRVASNQTHCFDTDGAPVILAPTSTHECAAHTYIPPICVYEDWSGIKQVKATIPGTGTWVLTTDGTKCEMKLKNGTEVEGYCFESHVQVKVPKTEEPIRILYEVYDSCHNIDSSYCYILAKDQVRPVPVVDKGVTVSLSDKKVWVDAETFDEGSWDNCGVNLLLARRSDWYEACIDLCDDTDWCCRGPHGDTLWMSFLEDDKHVNEVEAHYAKTMDWLANDGDACGQLIYNAWQYDLMKHATLDCIEHPYEVDDHYFRKHFEECFTYYLYQSVVAPQEETPTLHRLDDGDYCFDKFILDQAHQFGCKRVVDATNVEATIEEFELTTEQSALIDTWSQIGGGWSDAVPFSCEDACGPVTVEVLVMDYWCNWATAWTKVWVEDKTPVEVVKDVVLEESITCKIYKDSRYAYPDEIHPVSLEYIVGQAKAGEQDAYDALDEIFGGYCKAWRDPYGSYVDAAGKEIECDIPFYDSVCKCTSYYDQVRVYDEHQGYLWVDTLVTHCEYYQDTVDFQKGVIVVNCEENVYCEQDIWCDFDHCGQGYIFRKFKIWQGCPDEFYDEHGVADSLRHTVDTIYRHQRIWVGNECELNKYMFDVPKDTEVETCEIAYGPDGNVIGAAGPESTGYAKYKFDDDCRIIGIAHSDKVFKIVGGEAACYKILRTWYFADWCGYGEPLDGQWWKNRELVTDTCVQKIIVIDNTPPTCEIVGPVEDGGSIDVGACYFDLEASVIGMDACGVIKYYWELKDVTDEDAVTVVDSDHGALSGDTTDAFDITSADIPHGSYKLVVTIQDDCANESYCEYYFDVVSVKKPSPVCVTSISATLTPWDSDQDGEVDSAHAVVWAEEFNSSSAEACNDTLLEYRIELIDGMDDDTWAEDTSYIELGCSDAGSHMARLWVISHPSGTVNFCNVVLLVASNSEFCGGTVGGQPGLISQVNDMHDVVEHQQKSRLGGEPAQLGIGGRPLGSILAPTGFSLEQNRPNPFREETTIGFALPEAMEATLTVYDVTGRVLRSIRGDYSKGYQTVQLQKANLAGHAILYYRLDAADFSATKKMILMK